MAKTLTTLLALASFALIAGCGEPQSTQPPVESPSTAEPVPTAGPEAEPAEAGLVDLPTHWLNTEDIGNGQGPVSDEQLRAGLADADSWLLYGGNYANYRHSPVEDFTPETVPRLKVSWSFPTGTTGQFEVSPVVYDGIMYVSSSYNRLFALDPATGQLFWRYDHQQPEDLRLCCGPVNRGVAIGGNLVLMATLDAKLLAFDRITGAKKWEVTIAPYQSGFSTTSAPMVVGDMAVIGIAGGEYGVRGFFDAYEVASGKRLWRHYTVPAAGEPGVETWSATSYETGGAPAWTSGAYDPESDTLYWTTGNPAPDWNGDDRLGDNLYSNSVLAIVPATGERKWHFQFTPHDVWDFDGNTQVFLTDIEHEGQTIEALVQANRNGYFYILDRTDGTFLRAEQYVEQLNWATIDENGRPVVDPKAKPEANPDHRVCPSNLGGMNGAWTGAMNPELGLAYIPVVESCQLYEKGISVYVEGQQFTAGTPIAKDVLEGKAYGHISAIDVNTGQIAWRYRDEHPMMGGVVSTAGGVVFTGNQRGHALALDSTTGEVLWRFKMGGGVRSQPIVYRAKGKAYLAIGSGNWTTFAAFSGGPIDIPEGGQLFVFELP